MRPQNVDDQSSEDREGNDGVEKMRKHNQERTHLNRHHKKYEKTIVSTPTTSISVDEDEDDESKKKILASVQDEKILLTDQPTTISKTITESSKIDIEDIEIVDEQHKTIINNVTISNRGKKGHRRQKFKESGNNRTSIEEERINRRKKINNNQNHNRRNNTVFTNSVHDDIIGSVNLTDNIQTVTTLPETTLTHRHNHHNHRHKETAKVSLSSTSSTISPNPKTLDEEIPIVNQEDTELSIEEEQELTDHFTNLPDTTLLVETTTVTTLSNDTSTQTVLVPKIRNTETSYSRDRGQSSTFMFTTTQRSVKNLRNRTSGGLGPARIDVTILEPSDRKYKQGEIITIYSELKSFIVINRSFLT